MSIKCLFSILFLYTIFVIPQTKNDFTGRLSADSRYVLDSYKNNTLKQNSFESPAEKKSVLLAGVLSGILPGAGEVYAGGTTNYLKAGAFVLVEAVSIYYAISYNQRGDAQTNFFQNYADQRWSVVSYAKWINAQPATKDMIIIHPQDAQHPNPWQQVDWANLNAAEDALGVGGGVGFTHKLPKHGEQQYYELIGKYPQYARGWEDNTKPGDLDNPDFESPEFQAYSIMRGDANNLYKVSSRGTAILYVNHLLSILDAIWSSVTFNKSIALNVRYERVNLASVEDWEPTLHLKFNF